MRGCALHLYIQNCARKFFLLEKCTLSAYCADMAACGLSEAIQSLPPELREMILKEYIAIKIKEKKEMGWDKVHENIFKLPFCKIQAADCADGYLH